MKSVRRYADRNEHGVRGDLYSKQALTLLSTRLHSESGRKCGRIGGMVAVVSVFAPTKSHAVAQYA